MCECFVVTMQVGDSDAATVPNPAGVRRPDGLRRVAMSKHDFEGWTISVLKSPILPSNCYCDVLDGENTKGIVLETGQSWDSVLSKTDAFKCQVCR